MQYDFNTQTEFVDSNYCSNNSFDERDKYLRIQNNSYKDFKSHSMFKIRANTLVFNSVFWL